MFTKVGYFGCQIDAFAGEVTSDVVTGEAVNDWLGCLGYHIDVLRLV